MSYSAAWNRTRTSGDAEGEWVDQVVVLQRTDLDQAGLVEVVIEAVRLGIDSDNFFLHEVRGESLEVALPLDDLEICHHALESNRWLELLREPVGDDIGAEEGNASNERC